MAQTSTTTEAQTENTDDNTPWWVRGHVRGYNNQGRMFGKVVADTGYTALVFAIVAFGGYTAAKGMDGASAVLLFAMMGVMAWFSDPPRHLAAWVADK